MSRKTKSLLHQDFPSSSCCSYYFYLFDSFCIFRAMFAPACLSHEVITRKWVYPAHPLCQTNLCVSDLLSCELTAPPCVVFQLLDRCAGQRYLLTPSPALLGPQSSRQQEQQGSTQRLPGPSDRQLPVAALQPHLPYHPRPVHRPRDERHSVPHAHGLWCAKDGPAAGHGPQQATGHAQQRQLKGHVSHTASPSYAQAGLAGLCDQSPMPNTSKYQSNFTTLSTYSRVPSCLQFTLVQASVKQRGLDLSHSPCPHTWWQVQGHCASTTRHSSLLLSI